MSLRLHAPSEPPESAPPAAWWQIPALVAALAAYSLVFHLLHPVLGSSVATLGALTAVLGGWWFGRVGGVAAAVACVAVDGALFATHGGADIVLGLPDIATKLLIGFTVGSLRDLRTAGALRIGELERTRGLLAGAEERYQEVVESASDIIYLSDPRGRFTYVNPVAARMMGYRREQLVGMDFRDLVRADHREILMELYRAQAAEGAPVTYAEFPAITGDGREVWIGQNVQLLRTPEGEPAGFQAVARDVTAGRHATETLERSHDELERRVAERTAELAAAEARRRHLLAASPVVIFSLALRDGHIVEWSLSENLERLFGYRGDEVGSREWFIERVHPDDRAGTLRRADEALAGGRVVHEFRFRNRQGEYRHVLEDLRLLRGPGGEAAEVVGSWTDITERHEREAQYRLVVESASDAIITVDTRGEVVFANPAVERIFGYAPGELMGTPLERLMPEPVRERHRAGFDTHVRTGVRTIAWERVELPGLHRAGHEVPLELSFGASPGGRHFTAVVRDLTDRQRAAALLRESEELYRGLYEENPSMLFMVDAAGTVLSVNNAGAAQLGYAPGELLGIPVSALFNDDDEREGARAYLRRCFASPHETHRGEFRKRHRDGRAVWVRTAVRIIPRAGGGPAALVVCEDVTRLRRTTEELREAERRAQGMARRMSALAAAGAGVIAAQSADELLAALHDACAGVIPFDAMLMARYRPEADTLVYLGAVDAGVWSAPQEVSVAGRPTERVIRERRSSLILSSGDPAGAGARLTGTGRRSESIIRTPVLSAEGVAGLISVQSYQRGAYGAEDVEVLETLAAVAAPALLNLQLLSELRESESALRESETRFRGVVESLGEALLITDLDGRIVYANPRSPEVLGFATGELVGEVAHEFLFPPQEHEAMRARLQARDDGPGHRYRACLLRGDGAEAWTEISATPLRDAQGRVVGTVAAFNDVTERHRAEMALREARARAERLAERMAAVAQAAAGFVEATSMEELRDVLRKSCARVLPFEAFTFGRYDEASQTLHFLEDADAGCVLPPMVVPLAGTPSERVVRERRSVVTASSADPAGRGARLTGTGVRSESVIRTPILDGDRVVAVISAQSYTPGLYTARDAEVLETVAALTGTAMANIRLLSERRASEDALRESEARFRAVFDDAGIGIALGDTEGRVLEVNPALQRMMGYPAHELRTLEPGVITHPDDREPDRALYAEVLAGRRDQYALEKRYLHREGHVVWARLTTSLIRGAAGEPRYLMSLVEDVTAQRQAQEALRASEAQLRAMFDEAPIGVALLDMRGRLVRSNAALQQMLGYAGEELAMMEFSALTHPDDIAADWELFGELVAGERGEYQLEKRYFRKDGSMLWGHLSVSLVRDAGGEPRYAVGMVENVTEHKAAERALEHSQALLLQAQKMEAVGRLAGGVAHDFNNMLTAIRGNAELLLMDTPPDDPRRLDLEEIQHAANRSADLTRQLLAFSRQQVLQPRVLELNQSVAATERMLRRLIGEDIDLATMLDPALGRVTADPGQVEQVLLNLAVNARDAMPQGGKLWIKTANVYLPAGDRRLGPEAAPGPYVAVTVVDTGCGMDDATLARIWEPFFTTKEQGKGTGLGLSTVYGIVRQSGGTVWAESEPDRGTAITTYFPRTDRAACADEAGDGLGAAPVARGTETVLVVEDEAAVRRLTTRVLARSGFRVLEASEPVEALELFRVHGAEVDLVLTDLVMPGMDGIRLAEILRERTPSLPVIFSTGYSAEALDADRIGPGAEILLKPFSPDALVRKVREVLDSRAAPSFAEPRA